MKKEYLTIILTFVSSVLIFFIGIIFSPNIQYFGLTLILAMSLFMGGVITILWKITRSLKI